MRYTYILLTLLFSADASRRKQIVKRLRKTLRSNLLRQCVGRCARSSASQENLTHATDSDTVDYRPTIDQSTGADIAEEMPALETVFVRDRKPQQTPTVNWKSVAVLGGLLTTSCSLFVTAMVLFVKT